MFPDTLSYLHRQLGLKCCSHQILFPWVTGYLAGGSPRRRVPGAISIARSKQLYDSENTTEHMIENIWSRQKNQIRHRVRKRNVLPRNRGSKTDKQKTRRKEPKGSKRQTEKRVFILRSVPHWGLLATHHPVSPTASYIICMCIDLRWRPRAWDTRFYLSFILRRNEDLVILVFILQ